MGRLFEDGLIPFGERTAQMYMAVAQNPQLANPNHGSCLPASWRTLYELTTLPEPTLKHALKDGLITLVDLTAAGIVAAQPVTTH